MAIRIECDDDILKNARRSSLITQDDMAKYLGISVPTIVTKEKDPASCTIHEVAEYYKHISTDGQKAIREWVMSFFTL